MLANRKLRRRTAQPAQRGLSLVEVLITVAIISILAGLIIPQLQADIPDRLRAAGQIVAADLEYARSLAIANSSKYRVVFDCGANKYHIEHSGASALLEALPANPFRPSDDEVDKQTTDFSELPFGSPPVELIAARHMAGGGVEVTDLEFAPHGGTTVTTETVVWLACGYGDGRRFLALTINPTTGLVDPGEVTARLPTGVNDRTATASSVRGPLVAMIGPFSGASR